jgi:hypothetical protein
LATSIQNIAIGSWFAIGGSKELLPVAEHTFQCAVGDRSTPLSVRCYDDGKDNDLTGLVVKFAMDQLDGTNKLAATAAGVTIQPGLTFTADTAASPARFNCVGHGFKDHWEVKVSSATTLPSPLSATTRYFTRDVTPNHFKLCTEPNGPAIPPTNAGTGAHTIKVVGQMQYAWEATDVATGGSFRGFVKITDASGFDRTFPNTAEGIGIEIVTAN